MQNLIKSHKNKLQIIALVFSPLLMAICNVLVVTIFNLGTYLGTFWRHLFHLVVC